MKSLVLLGALLLVIVAIPLGESRGDGVGVLVRMFYMIVFCIGGYLLSSNRRWLVLFLCFALPSLVVGSVDSAVPGIAGLFMVRQVLLSGLQLLLIWAVIRYSLFCQTATSLDRIIAGICGYLIIGLMWENLYEMVEHLSPGSFLFADGSAVMREEGSFLYFSLVTLSTLGYGDITPTAALPRTLAALEAVMGTLYLAVFVASLVSSVGPGRSGDGEPGVRSG